MCGTHNAGVQCCILGNDVEFLNFKMFVYYLLLLYLLYRFLSNYAYNTIAELRIHVFVHSVLK